MTEEFFDFTRKPNVRQRRSLENRRKKLHSGLLTSGTDADRALRSAGVHTALADLRIRSDFIVHKAGVDGDYSDRRVLAHEERPGLTKTMSSTGLGMRLMLTALAIAQAKTRPGLRYKNAMKLRGSTLDGPGWVEVVAAKSQRVTTGETSLSINDKKERQVKNALNRLAEDGMVVLGTGRGARKYDAFGLLEEGDSSGARRDYTVPMSSELTISLPATFITRGWIHLLEDTEIALLCMLASGMGSIEAPPVVAIPAHTRNVQYGIGREAFESYRFLEWFGLISVTESGRNSDGTVAEFADAGAELHRLTLLSAGFDRRAFDVVPAKVQHQLDR